MKACFAIAALVLIGATSSARAQSPVDPPVREDAPFLSSQLPQPAPAPPTPRHTGIHAMVRSLGRDFRELPSKENLYWVAVGGAGALAVHRGDGYVQSHMIGNQTADHIFEPGKLIGIVGPLAGSITTYAWGRISDNPRISHVGSDLIESQVVVAVLTQGLKYATRRERPDLSAKTSFPSGHASSTFAFATALERHLGWRYAVPAYLAASYVAASRLPANRHWASDVVFGAAIGIISGRTVTSNEVQPYPVSLAPTQGGAMVMFAPRRFNR